jgi:peptidoglycan DL-endopeptidase CwlO
MDVRRVVSTGALALALLAPALGPAGAAHADPLPRSRTLQAQADALRARVDDLRLRQSIATEAYDTAVEETSTAATEEVRAQAALDAATGHRDTATADATRRVRSLYMSGGGTLAGGLGRVLGTGDLDALDDAARTARITRDVVTDDTATVTAAASAQAGAAAAETHLQQVRAEKTAAQAAARSAREQVTAALAEQESLLGAADSALARAVAEEEEQARQAALAAAAQEAAAAGVRDAAARAASAATATGTTTGTTGGAAGTASVADAVAGASGTAEAAIAAARTRAGLPYVWGATGPTTFDCSGLTQWAYRQAGTSIPRTSRQQYAALPKVALDQLQPGDLVFYASGRDPSSIHHVALYLGGGRVLHAPHTGDVVREAGVAMPGLFGAVRPPAG